MRMKNFALHNIIIYYHSSHTHTPISYVQNAADAVHFVSTNQHTTTVKKKVYLKQNFDDIKMHVTKIPIKFIANKPNSFE